MLPAGRINHSRVSSHRQSRCESSYANVNSGASATVRSVADRFHCVGAESQFWHSAQGLLAQSPAFGRGLSVSRPGCSSVFSQAAASRAGFAHSQHSWDSATVFGQEQTKELLPGFRVIIAGAGIAGLTLALGLLKKGIKVQILERDLTAVRGEGKLRGPIQVQSNALAALEAIDTEVAEKVMNLGCITGDRINGLCDGVSGDWYVKFDTFHPAADRGLPITRVISRITLQQLLVEAVEKYGGPDVIIGASHVVQYEEYKTASGKTQVAAITEDGRRFEGDVLLGTDGIWSKIRKQMLGETRLHYSAYTCYTGISEYVPAEIDFVAYRVYLGSGQYFVCSDVGEGRMQWYAFQKEPPGGTDPPGQRKARLLKLFSNFNYNVVDLIRATPEEDVMRRDIYDRPPVFKWCEGRVALMGDSAHAMQPNLGQGGCMAIEDAFELVRGLTQCVSDAAEKQAEPQVVSCLKDYTNKRLFRVSAIHGMASMAAFMASTYQSYLGQGFKPLEDLHILHPGRLIGQGILKLTMPMVLEWVLGGNTDEILKDRIAKCKLDDKPKHFAVKEFPVFMHDDEALARRAGADWLLVAERVAAAAQQSLRGRVPMSAQHATVMAMTVSSAPEQASYTSASAATATQSYTQSTTHASTHQQHLQLQQMALPSPSPEPEQTYGLPPMEYKGVYMNLAPVKKSSGKKTLLVGNGRGCDLIVDCATNQTVVHAEIEELDSGKYMLHDMGSEGGCYVNGRRVARQGQRLLHPGDQLEFGQHPAAEVYTVKLQHKTYRTDEVTGDAYHRINTGAMSQVA